MSIQPLYGAERFDRCQFDNKRQKAVSSESRIAFSDLVRMGVERRSCAVGRKNPIPLWVFNDELFRQVVLLHAERRLHIFPPEGAADDERMYAIRTKEKKKAKAYTRQLAHFIEKIETKDPNAPGEIQVANLDRQIMVYRRGILEISTAVAYRSYRTGFSSPEVAEEFQLSAPGVRQMLYRLNKAAKILTGELPPRKISDNEGYRLKIQEKRWNDWKRMLEAPRKRASQRERARKFRLRHPGRRRRPYSVPSEQRVQRRRECRKKYIVAAPPARFRKKPTIMASPES